MSELGINELREKIILKGYANQTDIRKFCQCSNDKAKNLFNEIKAETESEEIELSNGIVTHRKINPCGIRISRLLERLEMKESNIFKYAERERQIKKDA